MAHDDTVHPSDASYEAGQIYAQLHGELPSYEVAKYARMHAEDQDAFIDGYWDIIHGR